LNTGDLVMTDEVMGRQNTGATGAVAMNGRFPHAFRTLRRGYSLIEMIVALMVVGVLISMGIPRFQQSLEQARANVAGANLQAIWSAQRLYWLVNRTYATDLPTLLDANPSSPLIDPALPTMTAPYTYAITGASDSGFTATATRTTGSSGWIGSFTVIQDGTLSGSLQQSGNSNTIVPGFQ
jgi:prepilin-type N-terminal cleavage/methylation domain-containing protein